MVNNLNRTHSPISTGLTPSWKHRVSWCQYIMEDARVLLSTVWVWNGEDLIMLTRSTKMMSEIIPAHWNEFWGPTESLLRRGENVATASMSAQIAVESSYIMVLSNNSSYLTTKSSPFQAHTVDIHISFTMSLLCWILDIYGLRFTKITSWLLNFRS